MAQRGQPSVAHEYDARGSCIHCGMYKVNVDAISHACKPWRELAVDNAAATIAGKTLSMYRTGTNEAGSQDFRDAETDSTDDPSGQEVDV
jgi:hypothetical protein